MHGDCPRIAPTQRLTRRIIAVRHRNPYMDIIDFELDRDFVELNQLLKLTGIADSGGQGKAIVANGEVRVDGMQELRKTAKIRAGQTVELDGVRIRVIEA